jgi:hypothetical protein
MLFLQLGFWNHILFHRAVSPTCVDSGDRGLLLSAADPCVKIVYVKAYTLWSPIEIAVGVSLRGRYSDHRGCIVARSLFRPSWVYRCAVAIPTIVGVSLRGRYSDHRGCIKNERHGIGPHPVGHII